MAHTVIVSHVTLVSNHVNIAVNMFKFQKSVLKLHRTKFTTFLVYDKT